MADIRSFFGGGGGGGSGSAKKKKAATPSPKKRKATPSPKKRKAESPRGSSGGGPGSNRTTKRIQLLDSDEDEVREVPPPAARSEKRKDAKRSAPDKQPKRSQEQVESVEAEEKAIKKVKKDKSNKAAKGAKDASDTWGTELPLCKEVFVFTGNLDNFTRDDAADAVKRFGGRVTSAVSGKTTYLVTGPVLEDGRPMEQGSKYRKAQTHGTKILNEEEFQELIDIARDKMPKVSPEALPKPAPAFASSSSSSSSAAAKGSLGGTTKREQDPAMMLWVDKYKPKTVQDLVGNATAIACLARWLDNYEAVHIRKTKKIRFEKSNPGAKAVLLSGPPGIGKTSAAIIVAEAAGYDIVELNASDTRSKKLVAAVLGDAINSRSVAQSSRKRLLVMDEVDGMSADDRGGVQELIKLIKASKVPIICICNDRQKSAVRSLANHCYDLKFMRPAVPSLIKRAAYIAAQEGMRVQGNALEYLATVAQKDMRQVIGMLQMWGRSSDTMTYDDIKNREKEVNKDSEFVLSSFDAASFILNEHSKSQQRFDMRYTAFFVDYDLIPLMIQDNYPKSVMARRKTDTRMAGQIEDLEALVAAADMVCDADVATQYVRGGQNWVLLPTVAALNLGVASNAGGRVGFPGFPEWLGKNSSRNKKIRLLNETSMHMRQKTMINAKTLRLDYLCTLRDELLRPLLAGNKEAIPETVEMMDSYGLNRDDVFESLQELQIGTRNVFDELNSQMKSAFTRAYNKGSHGSQALVHESGIAGLKPTKRKKADSEAAEEDEEEEEDGGDDVQQLLQAAKKNMNKKNNKKSKTSPAASKKKKKKK